MLLGFHMDYWKDEYVEQVIGPFGKIINWARDDKHLARILVRARVVDLESIPQFIVFTDSDGFEGDSWTIQCEILQHEMPGAGPPDEDPIPEQQQVQGHLPFDFFGLGQQANMQQAGQNPQQQILIGEPPVQAMEEQQNNECHPWPEEIPAQQLTLAQGVNLNLAPPILDQDLNELPMAEDSQEILIHPMAQENPQANNADEEV